MPWSWVFLLQSIYDDLDLLIPPHLWWPWRQSALLCFASAIVLGLGMFYPTTLRQRNDCLKRFSIVCRIIVHQIPEFYYAVPVFLLSGKIKNTREQLRGVKEKKTFTRHCNFIVIKFLRFFHHINCFEKKYGIYLYYN